MFGRGFAAMWLPSVQETGLYLNQKQTWSSFSESERPCHLQNKKKGASVIYKKIQRFFSPEFPLKQMSPEALQCILVSALPWHCAPSFSSCPLGRGFNPMQCALPMARVAVLIWLCVCNERARLCCLWSEVLQSCCMLPHVRLGICYCVCRDHSLTFHDPSCAHSFLLFFF